jgi:hypothetical protein
MPSNPLRTFTPWTLAPHQAENLSPALQDRNLSTGFLPANSNSLTRNYFRGIKTPLTGLRREINFKEQLSMITILLHNLLITLHGGWSPPGLLGTALDLLSMALAMSRIIRNLNIQPSIH